MTSDCGATTVKAAMQDASCCLDNPLLVETRFDAPEASGHDLLPFFTLPTYFESIAHQESAAAAPPWVKNRSGDKFEKRSTAKRE
jgi:hypothetical protein